MEPFKEFSADCPWNCKTGNPARSCGVITGQHGEPGPCWENTCGLWHSKEFKFKGLELYQCPYESATSCRMDMPCKGCETWAKNH